MGESSKAPLNPILKFKFDIIWWWANFDNGDVQQQKKGITLSAAIYGNMDPINILPLC